MVSTSLPNRCPQRVRQLEFLNRFVKLYNFDGLADRDTLISQSTLVVRPEINEMMADLRCLFSVKSLNLNRCQYRITTQSQAMALLRGLLKLTEIPFEIVRKYSGNWMRLKANYIDLVEYIIHMMKPLELGVPSRFERPVKDFYIDQQEFLVNRLVCLSIGGTIIALTKEYEYDPETGLYRVLFFKNSPILPLHLVTKQMIYMSGVLSGSDDQTSDHNTQRPHIYAL